MTHALVVGAGGRLGAKIAHELIARGARVRVTERSRPVVIAGVERIAADLGDPASLARACEGIGVIVSAVQGLRDVIVDGQTRLLRAAEAAGVARMIPSDYSLDFFATAPGGNRNLDLRREFDGVLDASRVRGTSVLCGAFMDLIAMGAIGPDRETGAFRAWGDPDQPYDYTHTDDVARFTAAAALDDAAPRVIRVAGDTASPRELAAIFGASLASAGTLDELTALIDRLRAADPAPADTFPIWQRLQYTRDMASGLGRILPLDNARYPEIRPRTIRELLATSSRASP